MVSGDELIREDGQEIKSNNCLILRGTCFGIETEALVDTGSSVTAVSAEFYERLKEEEVVIEELSTRKLKIQVANKRLVESQRQIWLELVVAGFVIRTPAVVIKGLIRPIILGTDCLGAYGAKVDVGRREICLHTTDNLLRCPGIQSEEWRTLQIGGMVTSDTDYQDQLSAALRGATDECNSDCAGRVEELIVKYQEVFGESREPVKGGSFKIELTDDTPFNAKRYPVPHAFIHEVRRQICKMEEDGIVAKTETPYVSPLVVVRKKNDKIRLCLDARKLNARTIPRNEAPPRMDEMISKLRGAKIFSGLDFTASYWQLAIAPDCQKYVGFAFGGSTYCFKRVPFGLKNSGAALINYLDSVIPDRLKATTLMYVDDIVLFSTNIDEHLINLEKLLSIFKEHNLKLNLEKCRFSQPEVEFMGHIISCNGMRMQQRRIDMIQRIPRPRNVRDVRRLLGVCNYYARFCKGYSSVIYPLLGLLKKGRKWSWDNACQQSFEQLKELFYRTCVIQYPDFSRRMYLQVDSSGYALGAVLFHRGSEGQEEIIALESRVLKPREQHLSTTERECLSIVWSTQKLKPLLVGRKFTIITDHKALVFLMRSHVLNDRLLRWSLWLQQLDFEIEYCEGQSNLLPDYLSRIKMEEELPETAEEINSLTLEEIRPKWTRENIARIQNEDEEGRRIISDLTGSEEQQNNVSIKERDWRLYNGMLLRRTSRRNGFYRLWIPKSMRNELIDSTHVHYGHYGSGKIEPILRENCFWKGMGREIRRRVNLCDTCQRIKQPNRSYDGLYEPIIPSGPKELYAADLYGPLPRGRYGNAYIFVIMDVFSKLVRLYPIPRANTVNCLRKTKQFCDLAGIPTRILTDLGTQFTSERWTEGLKERGIEPVHTTVRSPQSNPSERVMREISRLFRVYVRENHRAWVDAVPMLNYILNNVPHGSTKRSPWRTHFNEQEQNPFGKLIIPPEITGIIDVTDHRIILEELRRSANKRGKQQKQHFADIYKVGDRVLVRSPLMSDKQSKLFHKFFPLFQGPYIIDKLYDKNVVLLKDENGTEIGKYNFRNIKPYVSSN